MITPPWVKQLYDTQIDSISEIVSSFEDGNRIVFLDAPTGSGKTLIAYMVYQTLQTRAIYLCSSLSLQSQFMRDYPDAALLQGRSNYRTQTDLRDLTAADCDKRKSAGKYLCSWCNPVSACPYEQAKAHALRSRLVCSNLYYFLYEANYVGTLSNRPLVIVDEADILEDILMSFIQFSISERKAKKYSILPPKKRTVESNWIEWAKESLAHIKPPVPPRKTGNELTDLKAFREFNEITHLRGDLLRLTNPDTGIESGGWIYTGYDKGNIEFKPITVEPFAKDILWNHGNNWLLMSATLISTDEMANSLAISTFSK